MADNTIALQTQQSQPLQNLSGIIGVASGLQNLQRGDIALKKEKELLPHEIKSGIARAETSETESQAARFKLNTDQAKYAMEQFGGLLGDERIKKGDAMGTVDAINEAKDRIIESGVPRAQAEWQAAQLISKAHMPGAVPQLINNVIRGNAGASNQAGVINAPLQATPTGGGTQFTQNQPLAAGGMQPNAKIANTIAPTQAEEPATDALGNPYIRTKTPTGEIGAKPAPGSTMPPLLQLPQGETPDTAKPLMQLRQQTNQAAAEVPSQRFNNAQIIKLAPTALTGTGGDSLAKILNAVGIQSTNDIGSDTTQLNHFIAQQTVKNAGAMGANTDAARKLAEDAVGGAKAPAQAIVKMTKINDAYATGLEMFNKGMESAIKNPANTQSIFAVRDFQNKWAQNFDPTAMLLHNAIEAKNKATNAREQKMAQDDIAEIVKSVGGKGSKGAAALAQKYGVLQNLSEGK